MNTPMIKNEELADIIAEASNYGYLIEVWQEMPCGEAFLKHTEKPDCMKRAVDYMSAIKQEIAEKTIKRGKQIGFHVTVICYHGTVANDFYRAHDQMI